MEYHQHLSIEKFKYVHLVRDLERKKQLSEADAVLLGDQALALVRNMATLAHGDSVDRNDFIISKQAFFDMQRHVDGLLMEVNKLNDCCNEGGEGRIEAIGQRIRHMILDAELPSRLHTEVSYAFGKLAQDIDSGGKGESSATTTTNNSARHHVRFKINSSVSEYDLPPEQQKMHVDVKNVDDVFHVMKQWYASLYSPSAIQFRREHGMGHHECSMAFIVQSEFRV